MTEWVDIPNWPGFKACRDGRILGKRGKVMTPAISNNGYSRVCFGISKNQLVHRLIVSAFIGPIPKGMQVNHKNGLRSDNRIENLEIVTESQNKIHSFRVLGRKGMNKKPLRGAENGNSKTSWDTVREIRRLHAAGATQQKLAAQFSLSQSQVSNIILNKQWKEITQSTFEV